MVSSLLLALCAATAWGENVRERDGLLPLSFYNASLLAQTRAAIARGDAAVLPAYAALLAAADAALRRGPWSVTQQYNSSLIPFPCSPRAYTSVGFYYWPCTETPPGQPARNASGCNASSGLPWRYWDGDVSPYAGAFDLFIWGDAASALQTLGLAYHFSGNETFAARAALLARAWFTDAGTGMLPSLDHAQFTPGVNTGTGTGIIDLDEYLATGLLDALVMLRPSRAWRGEDEAAMQAWARAYTEWLLTSPLAAHEARTLNNHRAYFDAQLLQLALYAGNASLAAARAPGEGAVLDVQIAPNGQLYLETARTRSQHYVSFCLHAYVGLAAGAARAGVDLWRYRTANASSLLAAVQFLLPYSNGSAAWPWENLDGPAWSWAELFDVYRAAAAALPAHAPALLAAADSTVNATGAGDVRRLTWPVAE